jgi:hypothetical protein
MNRRNPVFRRHFILSGLLLFASVGVDTYKSAVSEPTLTTGSKTMFPQPGPRRYPPGYRPISPISLAH